MVASKTRCAAGGAGEHPPRKLVGVALRGRPSAEDVGGHGVPPLQTAMNEMSSVPGLCLAAVLRHGKTDALNQRADGKWHNTPAATFIERVKNCALGLAALGVRPGDRIALLSENRPEWSIVDMAILSLGAINVPIYTTQAIDQIDYILSDSGAKAIFISNRRLFKHALPVLAKHR